MKDNIRRKLTELLLPQSVREDIIRDIFDVQQGSTYTQGIEMMKVLLINNLNLKSYLADVSIGCSNPPQGEMRIGISPEEDWSIQSKHRQDKFSSSSCLSREPSSFHVYRSN